MGVSTDAEVVNLALVAIGHSQFVDNLNEDSTEAKVAKAIFAQSRDAVLERFAWKFASLRELLADLGEEAARDGWEFAYSLPSNCIAPRLIVQPGVRTPSPAQRIPFDWEAKVTSGVVNGKVLLTDEEDAELIYTARVVAPTLWSPLFVDALTWLLASKFSLGITKKPAVALEMGRAYEQSLAIAEAAQLKQSRDDLPPPSEFITVRG